MGQLLIDIVFLSIKDCKYNENGSTGCSPTGTCICKEKYGGSKCQVGRLNSIFKSLPIFWFYALILIDGFYAHSVFKDILCFPNLCILICEFKKYSFSLGYSMFYNFTLWLYINAGPGKVGFIVF